jgi:nucleoid-associated protein YgaU
MSLMRPVRFVFGVALVAGGVSLAVPPAGRFVQAVRIECAREQATGRDAACGLDATALPRVSPPSIASHAPGPGRAGEAHLVTAPVAPPPASAASANHAAAGSSRDASATARPGEGEAPHGGSGMPWAEGWVTPTPPLGPAYRSALMAPPPPLLDEAPVAPRRAAVFTGFMTRPAAVPAEGGTPPTYRVRDGDDLASIATRFYGHPSAASRLWAANRDRLVDPALLPIGIELRLPPAWEIDEGSGAAVHAIEPRPAEP